MRVGALLFAAGCSFSYGTNPRADTATGDVPPDVAIDAALGPFGNVTALTSLDAGSEDDPTLTADLLEIYYDAGGDLYYSVRASVGEQWPPGQPVPNINTSSTETTPEVSGDGLTLFFSSAQRGGYDIYVSTRPNRAAMWSVATLLPDLNSNYADYTPTLATDFVMYLSSDRLGGAGTLDLYRSTRANATSTTWTTPQLVAGVSTTGTETEPCISPNETVMFFTGDGAMRDIFMVSRKNTGEVWGPRTVIDEVSSPSADGDPWLSPDGRTLVFSSDRSGNSDLYMATR